MAQAATLETGLWRGDDLPDRAGFLALPGGALPPLADAVAYVRANPLPGLAPRPEDFALDAARAFAAAIRRELDDGCGFAIVDRLPLADWSRDEAKAAYWLLSSLIARPVAQSWDGKLLYDVRDLGRPPGNGVRPDVTNAEQNFHTDNSYNHVPPWYVGLLCLQAARSGGVSSVISFRWALAEMRRRHPDLAPRLFEPFYFDRQREHAPGDVMVTHHPMFEVADGRFLARLSRFQVVNGQRLAGKPLDERGTAALAAFEAILNEPGAASTFVFQPGQIQYLNNRTMGHRRTGFTDWDEPERKRHLVRLWLRDGGRPGYNG